ncbi:MAG: cell wall-binding repeat-containing protein [Actinobacteria bacterium]|nr:cell wall-binding repeat-containing protein [Actinomycetota bacterium]
MALATVASTLVAFNHAPAPCGEGLRPLIAPALTDTTGGDLVLCTHGPDVHPLAGTDRSPSATAAARDQQTSVQAAASAPVATTPAQCYGDGENGTRVHVIYAHQQGTTNRATALDTDLRRWIGQTEWTVTASAARTGGRRHVRWLTEAGVTGGCRVTIDAVTLPSTAFADLAATANALATKGHRRADRKYLVFADVDRGSCGAGVAYSDDRPSADNRANTTVGYARVDRDCWGAADNGSFSVAAHELVHTLGGVQRSAPHATAGYHCTDEWDAMCYVDGAGVATTQVCIDGHSATSKDRDTNNRLLDCNHDDYFHTAPRRGTYLADHWNVADSAFLMPITSDGSGYSTRPQVAEDPQGRPRVWSGNLGGAHRPLLADAYGWERCDLPIRVAVQRTERTDGSVLGEVLDGTTSGGAVLAGDVLRVAVRGATDTVNRAVGETVMEVDRDPWSGGEPPEGTLVIRWGDTVGTTHVAVTTRAARIRAATLTVDTSLTSATSAQRELSVLQGMVQSLGLGRVGGTDTLMAPYPRPGADERHAMAALRFLYGQPCSVDARLDDVAPGHPAQRRTGGTRQRVDIASGAETPVAAAAAVAAWLRSERGGGWASRAVVCRDDVHADCLAGTGLIGHAGPILYVPGGPDGLLPDEVRDELRASVRAGGTITVLGGSQAVSDDVLETLRETLTGRDVHRIAGQDRYATAAAVARTVAATSSSDRVVLARADVAADAVAAGAAAAEFGIPVLLTAPHAVPPVTLETLTELGPRRVLITGGHVAVSEGVAAMLRAEGREVSRLEGRTRNETAVAIARAPELWNRVTVVDSGSVIGLNGWHEQTWTLALAAAAVGAHLDAPVLFTTRDHVPSQPPSGSYPGETSHLLVSLPVSGRTPSVTTVHVGGQVWTSTGAIEAFHGASLPGFDGNVSVRT